MKKLNIEQIEIINSNASNIRIIAGAGTGKTTILIRRIIKLIKGGVTPSDILALTFTNKAAHEIKKRINEALKEENLVNSKSEVVIYTYHGFCVYILNSVKDQIEQFSKYNIFPYRKNKIKNIIKTSFVEELEVSQNTNINDFISEMKRNILPFTHEIALEKLEKIIANYKILEKKYPLNYYKVYKEYLQIQIRDKFWDFEDLLVYSYHVLSTPKLLKYYKKRGKYIFADEFQDTNLIQYYIIKKCKSISDADLFVVGDPDQCIYEWRGAHPNILLNHFQKDYPDCKTFVMDINYRSYNNILKTANNLISLNYSDEISGYKKLISEYPLGTKVNIIKNLNDNQQAKYIIQQIQKNLKTKKYVPNDFVVLYRANYMSGRFELELASFGINYKVNKGLSFLERKSVKEVCLFFSILISKNSNSLEEIINIPKRQMGYAKMKKIWKYAHFNKITVYDAFLNHYESIFNNISESILNFIKSIKKYSLRMNKNMRNPSDILRDFLIEIKYFNEIKIRDLSNKKQNFNIDNVNEILKLMYEHFDTNKKLDKVKYLDDILLDGNDKITNNSAVSLMTIHAAKGLEFRVVYIVGMSIEKMVFNNTNQNEERRIYYVGMTRAKEQLNLSYSYKMSSILKSIVELDDEGSSKIINLTNNLFTDVSLFETWKKKEDIDADTNLTNETIIHPSFGKGYIIRVFTKGNYRLAEIDFKGKVVTININYVLNFCQVKHE